MHQTSFIAHSVLNIRPSARLGRQYITYVTEEQSLIELFTLVATAMKPLLHLVSNNFQHTWCVDKGGSC